MRLITWLSTLARSKPVARYVIAVCVAVFVVVTLYNLQIPHSPTQPLYDRPPFPLDHLGELDLSDEALPPTTIPDFSHEPTYETHTSPEVWKGRAEQVKQAFQHAYEGYRKYATGFDELRPQSNTGVNNFNGWNATTYDSLDTMLLMGLREYFADALPIIEEASFREVRFDDGNSFAPFFETVIRYLGGMLSAYALSGEKIVLERAEELATWLEPAFETPSGLPGYTVNTATGEVGIHEPVLSEVATCQLEWSYLGHATKKQKHSNKSNRIMDALKEAMNERKGGMLPTHWSLQSGRPISDAFTVGAGADSGHEYLLKQYLLTAQMDSKNLEMYILTTNHLLTNLLFVSPNRRLLYVTDKMFKRVSHKFEHLSCFAPGLLALGAHTLNLTLAGLDRDKLGPDAKRSYDLLENYELNSLHMAAAKGLATSCYLMYADQPTGLGPEAVQMPRPESDTSALWIGVMEKWRKGGGRGYPPGLGDKPPLPYMSAKDSDYSVTSPQHFLRGDTIESMFILWKTTGDPVWRERGWEIFKALEKQARTPSGYGTLETVTSSPARPNDEMPSYFLAETLKYLYLLFMDEDIIPLDKWVFNTKGHPFPIFQSTEWEA